MVVKKGLTKSVIVALLMISFIGFASADNNYITINSIKLNGENQVTVTPSESITASVNVTNNHEDWESTKYQIEGGNWICIDTLDHTSDHGTNAESFLITAPASIGTYDFSVKAYEHNDCDDRGDSGALYDGIIVVEPSECEINSDCNDQNVCTTDVCSSGTCQNNFNTNTCDDGNSSTQNDVCSQGTCSGTPIPVAPKPTCSPDYLADVQGNNLFDLNNYYFNRTGSFYVFGSADSNSGECELTNVVYNRTGYPVWAIANPQSSWEEWATQYLLFNAGENTVCCKPESKPCSNGNCQSIIGDVTCKKFCLDIQEPVMDSISDNTEDCDDTETKYWNGEEIVWDWTAQDFGCAGIGYYVVEVFKDDASQGTQQVTNETFTLSVSGDGVYYIIVTPVDKAGNIGEPITSDEIISDRTNPVVEITGDPWDVWYNHDFNVYENDSDNIALLKCQIAVDNDGDGSFDGTYSDVECNSGHLIDISEVCPNDGSNVCWIRKKAIDKACNEDTGEGHQWDLDRVAPTTTKTIGEPKVTGFAWMSWIIDWFITDETTITLTCVDGDPELSGCDTTYYKINNGSWTEYESPFTLGEDGVYNVSYYSVDVAGNIEELQSEIDKVDTLAPVTTKTIGTPKYVDTVRERLWVTSETIFTLNSVDSEVGCQETNYIINFIVNSPTSLIILINLRMK